MSRNGARLRGNGARWDGDRPRGGRAPLRQHPRPRRLWRAGRDEGCWLSCYRKDATGNPVETDLAKAGFAGDFIVTDRPTSTGQMAKVAALAQAVPGSVDFVEGRNKIINCATTYGGFTDTGGFDQSTRSAIHEYMRDLKSTVGTMLPVVP